MGEGHRALPAAQERLRWRGRRRQSAVDAGSAARTTPAHEAGLRGCTGGLNNWGYGRLRMENEWRVTELGWVCPTHCFMQGF